MGASLSLEYYIHSTGSYVWYLMMPLGLLFALIGKLTVVSTYPNLLNFNAIS